MDTAEIQPATATATFADSPIFVTFNQNPDRTLRVRNDPPRNVGDDIGGPNQIQANKIRPTLNQNRVRDAIFAHSTTRNLHVKVDALNDPASQVEVENLLEHHIACVSDKSFHKVIDNIFSTVTPK